MGPGGRRSRGSVRALEGVGPETHSASARRIPSHVTAEPSSAGAHNSRTPARAPASGAAIRWPTGLRIHCDEGGEGTGWPVPDDGR